MATTMYQDDFGDFLAEHESVHGVGRLPPTIVPPYPKIDRAPVPEMVQVDIEELIAESIAAEAANACADVDTVDESGEAGEGDEGKGKENDPTLSLGFKTVDFQKGNLNTASTPSVMRTVQALHEPDNGGKRPPICYCGAPRLGTVDVHLREDGGKKKAGVSGIWRCRNGEICPHCAEAATARRRDSYARVGGAAIEKGGSIVTLVLSVSHSVKDRLADLMRIVKKASTGARAGGTWTRTIKPAMGCTGVLVDHHVRHGARYGWHYHQHLSFFCVGKTESEIEAALAKLVERYVGLIARQGLRADPARQHIKVLKEDPEGNPYTYPADHNAGAGDDETMEIMANDNGEEESLSPLMLAERAAHGDEQAAALYMEFSAAIKGTRSVVVTPALAKALEIERKVEEPVYTDKTRLGSIPGLVWTALIDQSLNRIFLNRIESAGRAGWRAVRWWAMEQTGLTPAYSVELAHEVAALVQTWQRTDDPIVRELVNDRVSILKSDWAFGHGEEVVEATLDYVAAHHRTMTVDEERVDWWLSVLEGNADKIARRRRDAMSHTTLPVGDHPPHAETVPYGSNPDHVRQNVPVSQHI